MLSVVWCFWKSFAGSILAAFSSQNFLVCCIESSDFLLFYYELPLMSVYVLMHAWMLSSFDNFQSASPLPRSYSLVIQCNQVIVCSCRILNRRVMSVYVLLLAWNSMVSSCPPSWLCVRCNLSKSGCLSRNHLSRATGFWMHRQYLWLFDIFFTFSRVSQSSPY